jgi:peptidoglycan/xylan/chitin deacetylase (PgdA/CDA1 family)
MTDERRFAFRWDVDHRMCITHGIPRIREVCRRLGVRNTFFVNMGRSTNLGEWLGGLGGTRAKLGDAEAVHLIAKIGWFRFLVETLANRPVGLSFPRELESLQSEGHELGLHGGMDHVVWSRRFAAIPDDVLEADVRESLAHLTQRFGRPAGFAAPGFRSDARLMRLLDTLGFAYDGDAIGAAPARATADGVTLRHWTIPVTLCGPRTIPFLEWHGARGTPEATVLSEIDRHLDRERQVVMYGHPCYEGVRDALLARVFERALAKGFRFVTHAEIAARLEAGAAVA